MWMNEAPWYVTVYNLGFEVERTCRWWGCSQREDHSPEGVSCQAPEGVILGGCQPPVKPWEWRRGRIVDVRSCLRTQTSPQRTRPCSLTAPRPLADCGAASPGDVHRSDPGRQHLSHPDSHSHSICRPFVSTHCLFVVTYLFHLFFHLVWLSVGPKSWSPDRLHLIQLSTALEVHISTINS